MIADAGVGVADVEANRIVAAVFCFILLHIKVNIYNMGVFMGVCIKPHFDKYNDYVYL